MRDFLNVGVIVLASVISVSAMAEETCMPLYDGKSQVAIKFNSMSKAGSVDGTDWTICGPPNEKKDDNRPSKAYQSTTSCKPGELMKLSFTIFKKDNSMHVQITDLGKSDLIPDAQIGPMKAAARLKLLNLDAILCLDGDVARMNLVGTAGPTRGRAYRITMKDSQPGEVLVESMDKSDGKTAK